VHHYADVVATILEHVPFLSTKYAIHACMTATSIRLEASCTAITTTKGERLELSRVADTNLVWCFDQHQDVVESHVSQEAKRTEARSYKVDSEDPMDVVLWIKKERLSCNVYPS